MKIGDVDECCLCKKEKKIVKIIKHPSFVYNKDIEIGYCKDCLVLEEI